MYPRPPTLPNSHPIFLSPPSSHVSRRTADAGRTARWTAASSSRPRRPHPAGRWGWSSPSLRPPAGHTALQMTGRPPSVPSGPPAGAAHGAAAAATPSHTGTTAGGGSSSSSSRRGRRRRSAGSATAPPARRRGRATVGQPPGWWARGRDSLGRRSRGSLGTATASSPPADGCGDPRGWYDTATQVPLRQER